MSRVPKYRRHSRGYAFIQHRSINTRDHRLYLGKYNTPESKKRYAEFVARLAAGEPAEPIVTGRNPSIKEMVAAFLQYSKRHYARPDGLGYEYNLVRDAMKPLLRLYGDTPAAAFGPAALVKVRTAMARSGNVRSTVNHDLGRIKRAFRWASENEIVPPETHHKLTCVRGLYRGQENCPESPGVKPALITAIQSLLPHLSPTVAAMLQIQFYCGMRPGEVCIMRACDMETSGTVWLFRPHSHKTQWRGNTQVKAVPKIAQAIVKQHLRPDREAYLFSPADAAAWHAEQNAANRKPRTTKRYPCEVRRVNQKARNSARRVGKQLPGERYTTSSYRRALDYGFARAAKCGAEIPRFTPNQVRHAILTFVSQEIGQQAAQRWGGHENLSTTNIYTERRDSELIAIATQLSSKLAM